MVSGKRASRRYPTRWMNKIKSKLNRNMEELVRTVEDWNI